MKKILITLILAAGFCCSGFADEQTDLPSSADFSYKTTSGGFFIWEDKITGGSGEFGFRLISEKNNYVLRNCIFIQSEGGALFNKTDSFYGLEAGDKIIFGGCFKRNDFAVRAYGFGGASFCLFKTETCRFFEGPYLMSIKFGGGFEFQFCQSMAFVVEFGGTSRFLLGNQNSELNDFSKHSPVLTIGYRTLK
jgi:hypothetical protein